MLPGKRKSSFKLDSKPFPTIETAIPSKIAQADHGLGDIKAWEPPPSWNVPSISTSAAVGQILDGQQLTADAQYSAIYGVSCTAHFIFSLFLRLHLTICCGIMSFGV